jgi:hypothetical protein
MFIIRFIKFIFNKIKAFFVKKADPIIVAANADVKKVEVAAAAVQVQAEAAVVEVKKEV